MTVNKPIWLLVLALLIGGCGPRAKATLAVPPPIPSGPPEHDLAYMEGLKAFREGTPSGYTRAVASFRIADALRPRTCEHVMHLAESLFFLAQYQKNNWDSFQSQVSEANTILFFRRGAPECNAFESTITRLQALSMMFDNMRQVEIVAMLRHAIDVDPGEPMNWLVLSQVNPAPARGDSLAPAEHAAQLAPDLAIVQYELGNYLLRDQKTYVQARQAFERALDISPRHFLSIVGVVYSLSIEGDDAADRVEPLLQKAVAIAPTSLKVRTLLGDYYAGMEETDLAVEQYQAAVAQAPTYYPAHLAMGTTLVTADRSAEAEKAFMEVLKLDVRKPHPPHNGVDFTADGLAHYYVGNIWLDRGDLIRANMEYLTALSDISNHAGAIYGLGIVAYRQGKVDAALAKLDEVIKLDGERFPNAFLARGGIRGERRQFVESIADFDRAIEIYKRQVVALDARIRVDDERGWSKKAAGERRRKASVESVLEKALESRKVVEALKGAH